MTRLERIERLRSKMPKRLFFDKDFLTQGTQLRKKIEISYEGVDHGNVLNCSPLLTRDQEFALFRRLNFFKYLLMKQVLGFEKSEDGPPPCRPSDLKRISSKRLSRLEAILDEIEETRNIILKANTRLIIGCIKKFAEKDTIQDDDLFSDSYHHMFKVIDFFDHRMGFKFSTFCINALRREVWKSVNRRNSDSRFGEYEESESHYDNAQEANDPHSKELVGSIFGLIRRNESRPDLKIAILKGIYGFGEKTTMKDIGQQFGLSRERIRQIKEESILAVRKLAEKQGIIYDPLL